ncbi:MAG: MMPL family transporter [Acetobacteraceae bacterium]
MRAAGPHGLLLQRLLARLVDASQRYAPMVVLGGILLASGAGLYASRHLGVNTNTDEMFPASLSWRQQEIAFERDFPQLQGLLVAVIDAKVPEAAEETARDLARALRPDQRRFAMVNRPGSSPYFSKEGLLFLSSSDLTRLLNRIVDAQPFLGELAQDPTARGLFSALGLLGQGVTHGGANLAPYRSELLTFHRAIAGALSGHAAPLSWQEMLSGGLSNVAGKYQFVLFKPRQDFHALEPGRAATAAIRAAAARLPFVQSGEARVRITGPVALADAQFASVAKGTVTALVVSVVLITLWLVLAVRSWRLIVPILATLVLGLILTLFFAAAAIGTLNLVSVGFGVLFVGIAVDFAIQFTIRFREARHETGDTAGALRSTAQRAGGAILVAALATAAGFLAFVPTDFAGVAELGLIAGTGMLIAFLCTMTFLPAVITLLRARDEQTEVGFAWGQAADRLIARWHAPILLGFAALVIASLALAPRLTFDSNPLDTQNPNTEAMHTLRDLMNRPLTNPYSIDILAPNLAKAQGLAAKLKTLPAVSHVITLSSFVPQEQKRKLAMLNEAADIMAPSLLPPSDPRTATPADVRAAAQLALDQIAPALHLLPLNSPLAAIAGDLRAVARAPDNTVHTIGAALTRFLPIELDRLRTALQAAPATLGSVPGDLRRNWVLPDGRARIEVLPIRAAETSAGLHRFVAEVARMAPNASGTAVTVVATSDTIVGAYRSAALAAVLAIAAILLIALRSLRDAALVLAPLLLSAALTVLVMVLLPLRLNYANIIALPLLLGVGVSFNIYFVMNWRAGRRDILASATARAIAFSALTTGTAFGSLALSAEPGTASMGELLLISLGCTLLASLVFVPALLAAISHRPARRLQPDALVSERLRLLSDGGQLASRRPGNSGSEGPAFHRQPPPHLGGVVVSPRNTEQLRGTERAHGGVVPFFDGHPDEAAGRRKLGMERGGGAALHEFRTGGLGHRGNGVSPAAGSVSVSTPVAVVTCGRSRSPESGWAPASD